MGHLQVCLIFELDLLQNPLVHLPFVARVHVGIEPSDIKTFVEIYMGIHTNPNSGDRKVEGMFQINAITSQKPRTLRILTPLQMEMWRRTREDVTVAGFSSDPVGLVEFVRLGGPTNMNTLAVPLQIGSIAQAIARQAAPFIRIDWDSH